MTTEFNNTSDLQNEFDLNADGNTEDTITDPNMISLVSERIKDCVLSAHDECEVKPHTPFTARVAAAPKRFRVVLRKEEAELAAAMAARVNGRGNDGGETRLTNNSAAGMRLLLDVTTTDELRGYCELLGVTVADVDAVVESMKSPLGAISSLSFMMAIGVYAQNEREKKARGIEVSAGAQHAAEYAFRMLHGHDTLWEGVALAKRIWHGITPAKKRGRRAKNATARHFLED